MRRVHEKFQLLLVLIAILVILFASPVAAGELLTLEQILERYIDAMGGREAIARLETRIIIGKQVDDRPYQGPPVESKLEAYANATGDWTMILHEPDGEHGNGQADGKVWAKKPGQPPEPNEYQNSKLAFLLNPQGPLMIAKHFPNPRVTGTWDYDGVSYYKVENDLKFEYYTLYFEAETGMLTRIGYHWWLEGFRPVDGVMIPAKVVQGRKGGSTNLWFETVTHGAEVAEHLQPGGNIVDE